jgi:hypothetical protein
MGVRIYASSRASCPRLEFLHLGLTAKYPLITALARLRERGDREGSHFLNADAAFITHPAQQSPTNSHPRTPMPGVLNLTLAFGQETTRWNPCLPEPQAQAPGLR